MENFTNKGSGTGAASRQPDFREALSGQQPAPELASANSYQDGGY
jgi:hypothetical protein